MQQTFNADMNISNLHQNVDPSTTLPVICGVGSNDTRASISFIKKVGKFSSQICDGDGNRFLGYFENEAVAKDVYTKEKIKRVEFLIEMYKERIDPRVCKKLSQLAEEL